jgi:hypothetical protein
MKLTRLFWIGVLLALSVSAISARPQDEAAEEVNDEEEIEEQNDVEEPSKDVEMEEAEEQEPEIPEDAIEVIAPAGTIYGFEADSEVRHFRYGFIYSTVLIKLICGATITKDRSLHAIHSLQELCHIRNNALIVLIDFWEFLMPKLPLET